MKRTILLPAMAALLALAFVSVLPALAQEQSSNSGGPAAPNEVTPGTRFLIRLSDEIGSKDSKAGRPFTARTIEPIASADGTTLPAGAEIRGHVDKVEAAGKTGRAKMWLTFDDIKTPDGWMPLIAMVTMCPASTRSASTTTVRAKSKSPPRNARKPSKRRRRGRSWEPRRAWQLTMKKMPRWERPRRRPRPIWSPPGSARSSRCNETPKSRSFWSGRSTSDAVDPAALTEVCPAWNLLSRQRGRAPARPSKPPL